MKDAPPPAAAYGVREIDGGGLTLSPMRFTGIGSEYFRIWVVNMLLTLLTLGIYSAWAKVRKSRYFLQNTQLDGHAFDYHGDPKAILLGRVVALVLLLCYSFAFDVSRAAGVVMVLVMCAIGPWLFMRAQRFRLANTSLRGLRFGFDAQPREAYRVVVLPLVIWFSSAITAAFVGTTRDLEYTAGAMAAAVVLTLLLTPWMHHRLKAYQHARARYGNQAFTFVPATRSFYAIYGIAVLLVLVGALLGFGMVLAWAWLDVPTPAVSAGPRAMAFIIGGVVGLVVFLIAWPYFAARMQQVVWRHTRLGDVRFRTRIDAGPLAKLTLRNVLLTLFTLGLYWPFAAVALARYRIECMGIESPRALRELAQAMQAAPGAAAGDAVLDTFGLDIGL